MGNTSEKKLTSEEITELQLRIDVTKQDISQDYDLSSIQGVTKANEELISSFYGFSDKNIEYIKTQLFTQTKK